jgi:hypothetical protein
MLTTIFWIFFITGTLIATLLAFLYSRKGSHPRFRPNQGLVGMVFVILMVANFFVSLFAARVVGPPQRELPHLRDRVLPPKTNAADPENAPLTESPPTEKSAEPKATDASVE